MSGNRVAPLLCLAFLAAALWPLFAYADLHLQDAPNHLARAFILLNPDDPVLARNYEITWQFMPDLGWDLWAVTVGKFLPLAWTGKFFILATFLIGVSGSFALGRALTGRFSLVPLIAFPFFLSGAYAKGFLSFDLGFALSLWAMAWWAGTQQTNWPLRVLVATLFSTLLYVIHLYAFGIYGIFVLGFELSRLRREKPDVRQVLHLLRDGLQALPVLLLKLLIPAESAGGFVYLSPLSRLGDVSLLIDSNHPWIDIIVILGFTTAIITSVAKGWLRLSSGTTLVLLLYAILFVILPDGLGNTNYLPWRTLLPLCFVGILAVTPTNTMPRYLLPSLLGTAFVITLAVPMVQIPNWNKSAVEKQAYSRALESIPEGSKIFFAHLGETDTELTQSAIGAFHLGSYAVMEKRALVQSMFVYPGQHTIRFRDRSYQDMARNSETVLTEILSEFNQTKADLKAYIGKFDFVILRGKDLPLENSALPMSRLQLLRDAGDFRVYAVRPGS